ncbi:MAG: glycosyltransferase family 4 protein, partial [Acidobacteriota bacterium]
MRILISNHALDERAGTELYVRDIALALLARGHEPIVYSRRLGAVARELRDAAVPTLDDLSKLGRPPDLIHAQHHLETMTALARFPEVPALYVCHGWLPPEEAPPRHPRIQRYVAVDELVQQRLIDECGIDPALVDVHLNFVDLDRFPRRKPLPARPRRALVFSNYLGDDNHLPVLRAACERVGLELDAIGRSSGNVAARPEEVLGRYDLVFAKARAALEAASVGAAVVLCDVAGLGPLVTADEFDRLRAFNLGARLLREPVTIERVVAQINRYDPEDAAEVTRRLRREAGLDLSVDRLIATYGAVLEKAKGRSVSLEDESQAVARYLRWGPLVGGEVHGAERELLLSQVAQERQRVATLRTALEAVRVENEELEAQAAS